MAEPWNHNIHYHPWILQSAPSPCLRALEVGCGTGLLARKLAAANRAQSVLALDVDPPTIATARRINQNLNLANLAFVEADVLTHSLEAFDFVYAVATLHHLPLRQALQRFRDLLVPGGVLAVIGLYRAASLGDLTVSALAIPASHLLRSVRQFQEVDAPLSEPQESLVDIRSACQDLLPGAIVTRRLFFRYSLLWRKPEL